MENNIERKKVNYISPWIFTTYKCNLKCPYCYVDQKSVDISPKTLANISYCFNSLIENDDIDTVVFRIAGGEPFINFKDWNQTFYDFYSLHPNRTFISVLSNLTIIPDGSLQWLKDVDAGLGVSLDSLTFSKPHHNGMSSSKEVQKNIDRLIAYRGTENFDISTVIDKISFYNCEQMAHWIAQRNLNWGIYLDHFFGGQQDAVQIIDKMAEVISVLSYYKYDILNKFKFNNVSFKGYYEGCGAGDKLIAIGCRGEVWACQTQQKQNPLFYLSKETDLIQELKSKASKYLMPLQCSQCSLSEECHGGCRFHNNQEFTCKILKEVQLMVLKAIINNQ
jgi:radical SAM protein with 4Fe4S-binding SPASM domain